MTEWLLGGKRGTIMFGQFYSVISEGLSYNQLLSEHKMKWPYNWLTCGKVAACQCHGHVHVMIQVPVEWRSPPGIVQIKCSICLLDNNNICALALHRQVRNHCHLSKHLIRLDRIQVLWVSIIKATEVDKPSPNDSVGIHIAMNQRILRFISSIIITINWW